MRPAASPLTKIAATTAAEVCQRFEPSPAASQLAQRVTAPDGYLDALCEQGLYDDAYAFLAHGLPRREAILWCLDCVRRVLPDPAPAPQAEAVQAVEAWLAEPGEKQRRAAMAAAEAATYDTPAGCCALAVFLSGGSMAPPDCPVVEPAPELTPRTVASAVSLCSVRVPAETAAEFAQAFVARGVEVASSPAPWEQTKR